MEKSMAVRWLATSLLTINIAVGSVTGMGYQIPRKVKVDKTADPLYTEVLKKEYRTVTELLIFKYDDSKTFEVNRYGGDLPEKDQMKKKFPFRHYDCKILGVLPAGSVFKIQRVTLEGNTSLAFTRYYATLISSENKNFVGKEINPTMLTVSAVEVVRQFDPQYVEEVK